MERTPNFDNGRTGVTLNAHPPFFEWREHKTARVDGILLQCNNIHVSSLFTK